MSTSLHSTAPLTRQSLILLRIVRGLLGLFGLVGLAGAIFFTFFASPEDGGVVTAFDWFVAVWKIAVSVGLVVVAVAPRMRPAPRLQLATWLLLADVVFGLVKIVGYDERESWTFLLVDLVVLALVTGLARGTGRQRA